VVVLAPLLKQLLGLADAHLMRVNEVDVSQSLGEHVPLGRLHETCSAVVRWTSLNRRETGDNVIVS
jgi:hypothetical protein